MGLVLRGDLPSRVVENKSQQKSDTSNVFQTN